MGTRLHPVTLEIPKPLLPVQGRPIVSHIIEFLCKHNIREIGVIVQHDHRVHFARWKEELVKSIPELRIDLFQEKKPLGTFGYLPYMKEWMGEETIAFVNGDDLVDFDLPQVLALHKKHEAVLTLALMEVEGMKGSVGIPTMDGCHVIGFEYCKDGTGQGYISIGFSLLEPQILDYAIHGQDFMMIETDISPQLAKERKLVGVKLDHVRFHDCGTFERWEKAIKEW